MASPSGGTEPHRNEQPSVSIPSRGEMASCKCKEPQGRTSTTKVGLHGHLEKVGSLLSELITPKTPARSGGGCRAAAPLPIRAVLGPRPPGSCPTASLVQNKKRHEDSGLVGSNHGGRPERKGTRQPLLCQYFDTISLRAGRKTRVPDPRRPREPKSTPPAQATLGHRPLPSSTRM